MRVGFGNCCFGERTLAYGADASYVGLSGIAKQNGWSAPSVLSSTELAAAGSWAGYLGAAKLIALANNLSWSGPPSWATTTLYVGQQLVIPRGLTGGADDSLYTVRAENVSGGAPPAPDEAKPMGTGAKVVLGLLAAGGIAAVAFSGKRK